jgi:glycosyltransferase involved in cell wall biosynthesis
LQTLIAHLNFAKGFRGGERQTQLLIEELSKYGYKQKLILRKNAPLKKRCENIKNLTIIEIEKPYFLHLNTIKNATILHAHETKALQFAYFAHMITKIPYIVTRRVDNPIKNNFFNKILYTQAAMVVALSRAIESEIKKIAPHAKVTIIPSAYSDLPTDKENISAIKKNFQNKFIVGHVGALDDKQKGQLLTIELAKKLQDNKDILFVFVGGGKDELKLKDAAKELTNVHFVGFVNNVNDYIASFDLFLFPSRNEGLGSTLLDVISQNIPILASNVGGIPDIIQDEINGELFDIKKKDSMEKKLLDLYHNKDKREQYAKKAKEQLSRFSKENMTKSYISLYKSIEL